MRGIIIVVTVALAGVTVACGGDEGGEFSVELSGANEVCDDETACGGNGSGTAELTIDPDEEQVCYEFDLEGMQGVEAAHIHEGEEGQSGDPVVDLAYSGDDSGADDCVEASEAILEDVLEDPSGYYVNVHTEDLPDGAGRAQLSG